jgi:hypothetical protein
LEFEFRNSGLLGPWWITWQIMSLAVAGQGRYRQAKALMTFATLLLTVRRQAANRLATCFARAQQRPMDNVRVGMVSVYAAPEKAYRHNSPEHYYYD